MKNILDKKNYNTTDALFQLPFCCVQYLTKAKRRPMGKINNSKRKSATAEDNLEVGTVLFTAGDVNV